MTRRAPAVERVAAILNFLAAHPGTRFTLSEIARELRLNKATLHAILGGLVEQGYLVRAGTSYGLGPALVALGNAALASTPALDCAAPEMAALADETGLDVVASAAIHGEIVILARAGLPLPFGVYVQAGQRVPLAPPLGTVFVAWSGADAVERWLAKVPPKQVARYRKAIEAVRRRGYSVGLEAESQQPPARAPRRAERQMLTMEEGIRGIRIEEYAPIDLDPRASYRVNHVGTPVFGPDGEVALALFLIGFRGVIRGDQVERYAARLRQAAARVTKAIHGRDPTQ